MAALTLSSRSFSQLPCFKKTRATLPRTPARPVTGVRVRAVAATEVQKLNDQFAIPGHVEFAEGTGGLPKVVLKHSCGAEAEVILFGGCISSWKQANGSEVLYIRPDAVFDKSKPISGGIPICFPQFGPGAIQQHGFARNSDWSVASTSADPQPDEKDPEVELVLTDNDYTRGMWPYGFKVAYSISLHGELLRTDFRVQNTGDKAFEFTGGLHTYFEVLGIDVAAVKGLKGLQYLDKVADPNNPTAKTEDRELITFSGPVDSVYLKAPGYVQLDVGTGASIAISNSNWEDAVVWTPWDAMPSCYKKFLCVENVKASAPVTLGPGESWRAQTEFAIIDTSK